MKNIEKQIELDITKVKNYFKDNNVDIEPIDKKEIKEMLENDYDAWHSHLLSVIEAAHKSEVLPCSLIGIDRIDHHQGVQYTPYFMIDLESFTAHILNTYKLPRTKKATFEKLSQLIEQLCTNCPGKYKYRLGSYSINASLDTLLAFIQLYRGKTISGLKEKHERSFVNNIFYSQHIDVRCITQHNKFTKLKLEYSRSELYNLTAAYNSICKGHFDDCLTFLASLEPVLESIYWEIVRTAHILNMLSKAAKGVISQKLTSLNITYGAHNSDIPPEFSTLKQ